MLCIMRLLVKKEKEKERGRGRRSRRIMICDRIFGFDVFFYLTCAVMGFYCFTAVLMKMLMLMLILILKLILILIGLFNNNCFLSFSMGHWRNFLPILQSLNPVPAIFFSSSIFLPSKISAGLLTLL